MGTRVTEAVAGSNDFRHNHCAGMPAYVLKESNAHNVPLMSPSSNDYIGSSESRMSPSDLDRCKEGNGHPSLKLCPTPTVVPCDKPNDKAAVETCGATDEYGHLLPR